MSRGLVSLNTISEAVKSEEGIKLSAGFLDPVVAGRVPFDAKVSIEKCLFHIRNESMFGRLEEHRGPCRHMSVY